MKKRKNRKKCRTCGKKFGRRSMHGGATYCSTGCRDVVAIERALSRPDPGGGGLLNNEQSKRFIDLLIHQSALPSGTRFRPPQRKTATMSNKALLAKAGVTLKDLL